jgi:broad specificity phosphatase PhoE
VLTSPLSRAIETSTLAFASLPPHERPPVVALEALRPKVSYHMHSKRSARSVLTKRFPNVDLARLADDQDTLWTPTPEARASLDARARAFLQVLFSRPERNVAVVTHFTLLFALFSDARETLLVGENPTRPRDDPAFLRCVDGDDDNPVKRFLVPGKLRSFIVVPDA